MGIDLIQWRLGGAIAEFEVNEDEKWATLYTIHSQFEGKLHATTLLFIAKTFYESGGFTFGGSIALNDRMRRIYQRLKIQEYR